MLGRPVNEFIGRPAVQPPVKVAASKTRNSKQKATAAKPAREDAAGPFSFGALRYASKGPRRLFVPQKCIMSPVFEPDVERPHAILRIR